VLRFIYSIPGLKEVCHSFPEFLASYAPQLTIKGFGGEFENDFDKLLNTSVTDQNNKRAENDKCGSGLTTNKLAPGCNEVIALRHPTFGDYSPAHVACQFVQGKMWGPSPRYYEHFDYLVWFLSTDSNWLPSNIHRFLLDGMKQWAVWISAGDKLWEIARSFFHKLCEAKEFNNLKLNAKDKEGLLKCFSVSIKELSLKDTPETIMDRFFNEGCIEEYYKQQKRRQVKRNNR